MFHNLVTSELVLSPFEKLSAAPGWQRKDKANVLLLSGHMQNEWSTHWATDKKIAKWFFSNSINGLMKGIKTDIHALFLWYYHFQQWGFPFRRSYALVACLWLIKMCPDQLHVVTDSLRCFPSSTSVRFCSGTPLDQGFIQVTSTLFPRSLFLLLLSVAYFITQLSFHLHNLSRPSPDLPF